MKKSVLLTGAILAAVVLATSGCKSGTGATASGAKPYPLKKCVVSDEPLGSMGDTVVFVHAGQEIKLCCDHCREEFDKNPAKYLSKLGH